MGSEMCIRDRLQSLVARTQCGDLCPVLCSLLRDRAAGGGAAGSPVGEESSGQKQQRVQPRSVYRETLFLKSILTQNLDIGKYM